jgi:hypothetical protein
LRVATSATCWRSWWLNFPKRDLPKMREQRVFPGIRSHSAGKYVSRAMIFENGKYGEKRE